MKKKCLGDAWHFSVEKTTLKKGHIPETSVFCLFVCLFVFSKPFLTLFDIYIYINPIRYTTSFLDFSCLGTCAGVGTGYQMRLAMWTVSERQDAIVMLQDETDIQPIFSISRAKGRAR